VEQLQKIELRCRLRLTWIALSSEELTLVSITAIAADWHVSRPYASRCVNHLGCPRTSLQAAREWRVYCASKRPPTNPKQIAKLLEEDDGSEGVSQHGTDNPPPPSLDSLHDALDAAIAAQEQAFWSLQQANGDVTDSKMAMLLAIHNKALDLRLRAEAQYRAALKSCRSNK
jgi:hypothetical protein